METSPDYAEIYRSQLVEDAASHIGESNGAVIVP